VSEIRFHVPNSTLPLEPKEEKKQPQKKKGKDESKMEDEEEDDEEVEITPAQVLNDKIVKAAGLGEFAGEIIAQLPDVPMLVPRGKYSI